MGAIANAVADATGVRFEALPMSPPKVLAGLDARGLPGAALSLAREAQRFYADGDGGQCQGATGANAFAVEAWGPTMVHDTDDRGGLAVARITPPRCDA